MKRLPLQPLMRCSSPYSQMNDRNSTLGWRPRWRQWSVDERAEHGLDHGFDGRIIDALSLRQLGRDGFEVAIACRWRQRHRSLRTIASWLSDKRKMRSERGSLRRYLGQSASARVSASR